MIARSCLFHVLTLLFFTIIFSMAATDIVAEDPESYEKIERQSVLYSLAPGFTRIDDGGSSYFIDYQNRKLYHFSTVTGECTLHSIAGRGSSSEKDMAVRERGKLFSRIQSMGKSSAQDMGAGLLSVKRLVFAPLAMHLLTVRTPVYKKFGIIFTPAFSDYVLDSEHEKTNRLTEIALFNEKFYLHEPLLRQIDVVGLLLLLGAVPIQVEKNGTKKELYYQFMAEQALRRELPVNCLSNKQ